MLSAWTEPHVEGFRDDLPVLGPVTEEDLGIPAQDRAAGMLPPLWNADSERGTILPYEIGLDMVVHFFFSSRPCGVGRGERLGRRVCR